MSFKIYKGEEVVVEGESPLTITGLSPNTDVAEGEYQAVRVLEDKESAKVDIPAFKTLPIKVVGVEVAPDSASGETGTEGERQLTATISPANATNSKVSYVVDGEVEGLSVSDTGKVMWTVSTPEGEHKVIAKTDDGDFEATFKLTLVAPTEPGPEEEEE